ncbi:4-hydroxybutyrate CoA-transferase [Deltaproteobacteria bacterium]|nr:4-hydroxybutyrate CoA-transferase [Deltaproteobacteria bacterium]
MSWKEIYAQKCMDADTALNLIKSGDRVVVQHAAGEPSYLVETLVQKKEQYRDVEIVHMVAMGDSPYCAEGMEKHFRHNSLFVGRTTRKAVSEGRADYTPCYNSDIPRLFRDGYLPVDVALLHVSPPDSDGNVSIGISVDYTLQGAKSAKTIIAQVNKNMPRTFGQTMFPVSAITAFVEHDAPIIELKPASVSDVEKAIGENCAKLINDGDTLQLGIGSIPDAVLLFLKNKKDLGIHTEMFSDGVVELVEAGVITNAKKNFHPGKFVAAFLMGTRRLYDFVHENKNVEMRPVDYVTNPAIVCQNDNLVSINSCVQIDITGQVCSESIGREQISGPGGQVDFVRGASMGKNGRSIIAFPSTAAKGKISKIVPNLDEGAFVTTPRNEVDYIITEYGIARLRGRTLRQRAKLLIGIAHPSFREELSRVFEERYHCRLADVAV